MKIRLENITFGGQNQMNQLKFIRVTIKATGRCIATAEIYSWKELFY
jgi:hypothetical protein